MRVKKVKLTVRYHREQLILDWVIILMELRLADFLSAVLQAASQAQKDGAGSDRVLADFFQQLLKKSSTQPNSPGGSTPAGASGPPQDNTSTPLAKKPTTLNTSPLANMLNKGKK